MSIRKVIDWAVEDKLSQKVGNIASPFYQLYDLDGQWMWACDVDLGDEEVLRCVPVASNNRELIYAEQGRSVTLSRLNNGKWVITGLAKSLKSTVHYIYLSFTEDLYRVTQKLLKGYYIRPLTYGELGTLVPPYGYGVLPYGAQGKFKADGTFVEIMEYY
ncbi:MAG: hypothetical protein FJ135_01845 [Deltaproteobacteria bacterium]|nr:hypothetical protein [Deltaproteobacteria bacterium]